MATSLTRARAGPDWLTVTARAARRPELLAKCLAVTLGVIRIRRARPQPL